MTNAYLNLPGQCFVNQINVNEINTVNQINIQEGNVEQQNNIDEHDDGNDIEHKLSAHKLNDHPPTYHTNSAQTQSEETDSLQLNAAGIQLQTDLLSAFGFTLEQNITLLITNGRIVITTNPEHLAIMSAIEELQLRQDEIKTDFTVAIEALKGGL